MGIILPTLHGSRCCCCGCGGFGATPRFLAAAANGVAAPSSAAAMGVAGPPASPFLEWQKKPKAGQTSRVPVPLYLKLKRAEEEPVFTQARCGRDRDCVPGDGEATSYGAAYRGSFGWLAKGNGRFVDILTKPGRVLITHLTGSDADYSEFQTTDADEAQMQAIQQSPIAARYGFARL